MNTGKTILVMLMYLFVNHPLIASSYCCVLNFEMYIAFICDDKLGSDRDLAQEKHADTEILLLSKFVNKDLLNYIDGVDAKIPNIKISEIEAANNKIIGSEIKEVEKWNNFYILANELYRRLSDLKIEIKKIDLSEFSEITFCEICRATIDTLKKLIASVNSNKLLTLRNVFDMKCDVDKINGIDLKFIESDFKYFSRSKSYKSWLEFREYIRRKYR